MASLSVVFDLIARDKASRTLDAVGNAADDSGKKLGGLSKAGVAVGTAVGSVVAQGLTAGLGALKNFAAGSVDAFARVEDATGAAGVQFGRQLPSIVKFADAAAKNFGISKGAALDAANTFGTMGKAAGLQGPALSGFATKFAGLAGDLASFKGTTTEQAIEAIGSALRGEAEPIRAYGVLLDDASLRQEALAQGLIKTTKEALTPQQKVLASQALILKQTTDAQGDYARTSDSTANTQKTLQASIENAQAALGQKLAPALTAVRQTFLGAIQGATGLLGLLDPVAAAAKQAFGILFRGDYSEGPLGTDGDALIDRMFILRESIVALIPPVRRFFGELQDRLAPVLERVGSFITERLVPQFFRLVGVMQENIVPILSVLAGALGGILLGAVTSLTTAIGSALVGALVAAVTALASPIVVIGALAGGLVVLHQRSERFRAIATSVADFVTTRLVPSFQQFARFIVANAVPAFQQVAAFVTGRVVPALQRLAGFVIGNAVPALRSIAGFLTNSVFPALRQVAGFLISTFTPTFRALSQLVTGSVMPALRGLLVRVQENLPQFVTFAKFIGRVLAVVGFLAAKIAGALLPILVKIAGYLVSTLFGALGKLVDLFGSTVRKVSSAKRRLDDFIDAMKSFKLPGWVQTLADLAGGIGSGLKSAARTVRDRVGDILGDGPGRLVGGNTLRKVQSILPAGLRVTSTYRSPAQNARVGGSPTSYHLDRRNPAVDIAGPTALLDRFHRQLAAAGPWRELLWRVRGHFDHIHVAHMGGTVDPSWARMPGDAPNERTVRTQVGEVISTQADMGEVVARLASIERLLVGMPRQYQLAMRTA